MRFDDNKKYMIIPDKYDFCYFLSEVQDFGDFICVKYQGEWIGLVEKDGYYISFSEPWLHDTFRIKLI